MQEHKAIEVFYSYAHKDKEYQKELKKHLANLKPQGLIATWNYHEIIAGAEWAKDIDAHLNTASLFLLLISADFMASKYCSGSEMKRVMERYEAGEALVIPIILRPTDWKGASFEKLQSLPTGGKPVISWRKRDEAFFNIALGIRNAVEKIRLLDKRDNSLDAEKSPIDANSHLENEKISISSNIIYSTSNLNIPLFAENLEINSNQLKKNLRCLYNYDIKGLNVDIYLHNLGASLIEIVEKICQGIESNEILIAADARPFLLRRIKDHSERWPICFPLYEANLKYLLTKLVEEMFSSHKNFLDSLTVARESIENTLEYVHYQLVTYLKWAVWSDITRQLGYTAVATYLEKYEKYSSQGESTKEVLKEIYRYQNINVQSLDQIVLVASKEKSEGCWWVYFPNLTEDDKMEIVFNCRANNVILGYIWDVFFLPQIIGNALMQISFGEGKKIEELTYKVGLNMKDYECVGLP